MFPRFTKCGPCLCLFVCLMTVPPVFFYLVALLSPNQVVLDLGGLNIPAVYKRAQRYADGSIDLTINIPASGDVLKRLLDLQKQIKYNLTMKAQTGVPGEGVQDIAKTYYPLTLDSPYVINSPHVCEGVEPLHVLVVVHTATANFQRRRLIRETWAGKHLMMTRNQRLLFLLGLTANATVQRLIENERLVYGDLVQGQFKDTYHNLTHKGVLAYRWINQYCSHAQLIVKVDDDIYINPFLLYDVYFPRLSQLNHTLACHHRPKNTSPIQRNKGKWLVQDYEFRGYRHYPFPYCNGYVVLITPDIIKAMYSAAYSTPFFWVDDVYLYGMLVVKVGNVKYDDIHRNMTLIKKKGVDCYRKGKCQLLAMHAPDESTLIEVWQLTLTQIPEAFKPHVNPVYLVT